MRKFWVTVFVLVFALVGAGTALAISIYDPNLGHNRNVPIRSYGGIDTPRHGQFGDIELSGCQLVLDEPSLDYERWPDSPRWPVRTRMFLQCDPADLLFTGYDWSLQASRETFGSDPIVIDTVSGSDDFDSGPRVPGRWGIKLIDRTWSCKDINPGPRGTATEMLTVRGTVTLRDTEGRDYPATVLSRAFIACPTN